MTRQLLPIQIDRCWLAIDAGNAKEVLGPCPWVAVPGAGAYLPGVAPWRGRAVAVVDLAAVAGVGSPLQAGVARPRTVILQVGSCTFAVLVESVREVLAVDQASLRTPHAVRHGHASEEFDLDGVAVPLLDLTSILKAAAPSVPEAL